MAANLTTKLGQLVDVLTPDTTNTRIGVANASPTRTLDVTGTFGASGASTLGGTLTAAAANFSGTVTATQAGANLLSVVNSASTADARIRLQNTGGFTDLGVDATGPYWQANTFSYVRTISPLTMMAALTYGGITLSNAVTGTGSMVLSASPTLTGTVNAAALTVTAGQSQVNYSQNAVSSFQVTNSNAGAAAAAAFRSYNGTTIFDVGVYGPSFTTAGVQVANRAYIDANVGGGTALAIQGSGIIFASAGNNTESARFDTSGRLGIGMTPSFILDVTQSTNAQSAVNIRNTSTGSSASSSFQAQNDTGYAAALLMTSSTTSSWLGAHSAVLYSGSAPGGLTLATGAATPIYFKTNLTEVARIDTSGNLLVGTTSVGTAPVYTDGAVALAGRFITHQSGQSAAASATWVVLSFAAGSYGAALNGLLSVNLTYSGVVNTFLYVVCGFGGAGGSAALLNSATYAAGPYVTIAVYDPGGGALAVRLTNTSSQTVAWGYSWLNLSGNVPTYG